MVRPADTFCFVSAAQSTGKPKDFDRSQILTGVRLGRTWRMALDPAPPADQTAAGRTAADQTVADRTAADRTAADRTVADQTAADRTVADRKSSTPGKGSAVAAVAAAAERSVEAWELVQRAG